jgi:hypothetical protein
MYKMRKDLQSSWLDSARACIGMGCTSSGGNTHCRQQSATEKGSMMFLIVHLRTKMIHRKVHVPTVKDGL